LTCQANKLTARVKMQIPLFVLGMAVCFIAADWIAQNGLSALFAGILFIGAGISFMRYLVINRRSQIKRGNK
jgi:cytosine/uracil/thiamine/allantoin permease